MRFKIFWLIFVIVLAILIYFALPIARERYFNNDAKKIEIAPQNENSPENEIENQNSKVKSQIHNSILLLSTYHTIKIR